MYIPITSDIYYRQGASCARRVLQGYDMIEICSYIEKHVSELVTTTDQNTRLFFEGLLDESRAILNEWIFGG